jgi:hypothetical protein
MYSSALSSQERAEEPGEGRVIQHGENGGAIDHRCVQRTLEGIGCTPWFGSGARGTWTLAPGIHGGSLCGP